MHKKRILLYFLILISVTCYGQYHWQTFYEEHDKNQTPSYSKTIEFCKKLADESPIVHYTEFGLSHQGRYLPLLILDKDGNFTPDAVKNSGRTILLIQAAIHPGEPLGKDAGMMLFRDIAIHEKYLEYLDSITVLFIPIMNVDGHERFGPYNRINQNGPLEMGWRTNALNLNLNRDYLKADSKEIQAFLKLWHQWQPDFFIDTHSTNGGDYQYTMTYAMDIFGGANKELVSWITESYIPVIEKKMEEDDYPIFQYVTYRSWHDPRSGLISGVSHPMYSNGYASELNRPGLLLEAHMLKPYHMRVESTYLMILHTMDILFRDTNLKSVIREADLYTTSADFRKQPFPLRFSASDEPVMVDFNGVEYEKKISTLTGGNWFIYKPDKPITYQIQWYKNHEATHWADVPEAYIIPVEYEKVINRLLKHNIKIEYLKNDIEVYVQSYRFENANLSSRSNEGRQNATFKTKILNDLRSFPKGSAIVKLDQPTARVILHSLEPDAPGSLAYWGFFNSIFQRAEYVESYVMEAMAREMLDQDPELVARFKEAMEKTPSMKDNQMAILTWFYEQTPYYDQKHNIYPVGKIMTREILDTIELHLE